MKIPNRLTESEGITQPVCRTGVQTSLEIHCQKRLINYYVKLLFPDAFCEVQKNTKSNSRPEYWGSHSSPQIP